MFIYIIAGITVFSMLILYIFFSSRKKKAPSNGDIDRELIDLLNKKQ